MYVYKNLIQCKSGCDIKSVIDPLPFCLGREQKMLLGFSQVLKPTKWHDLLEEGKYGRNTFQRFVLGSIHNLSRGWAMMISLFFPFIFWKPPLIISQFFSDPPQEMLIYQKKIS